MTLDPSISWTIFTYRSVSSSITDGILHMQISQISQYHPLDLFSGSKDGIRKAIETLFITPQNNFRVFLNGSIIFGGMGGTADSTSSTAAQSFHDGLKHVISAKDGMHIKGFVDLLTETIFKSGLLNRLLEVQKLDAIDIEGAIHSYYDIISQPCVVCRQIGGKKSPARYSSIHSMQRDDKVRIVRDYLISATAKDLSMMISFKSKINMEEESLHHAVFLESSKQTFYYKVDTNLSLLLALLFLGINSLQYGVSEKVCL